MVEEVKEFIEYTINDIEQENWEVVFKTWYLYNKDYYFDDFIEVLESVGISVLTDSVEARRKILSNIAYNILNNLAVTKNRITFGNIAGQLNSNLGFNGDEITTMFNEAAQKLGLAQATNGWYRL